MAETRDKSRRAAGHPPVRHKPALQVPEHASQRWARAPISFIGAPALRLSRGLKLWLLLVTTILAPVPVTAQVSKEYQVKAVFLWRLAQFTHWPAEAFDHAESPVVICVLGNNPFGDALNVAVRGETAQTRKLVVQHHRTVEESKTCHILFFGGTATLAAKELLAIPGGRSVLTVTDADILPRSFSPMIRFVTEQNRIKLLVNLKAVRAARLVLDPRLLRAAEIVDD